jgi:DNA-binding transcriptional LysR family regulator
MNSEPGWDLYRSFHAVLREGSLSGAARALGLTQPSIARHIAALEEATGTTLFMRTQRGVSPTEAAQELRPYADMLAATSAALLRTAAGRMGEVSGTVRITASEIVGSQHLPAILAPLRARFPALTMELSLSNSVHDLLQRQADIAVRMVQPAQQALLAKKIGSIPLGLHAHRAYLDRRGVPATMDELGHHDLIGFDVETPALRALVTRYPQLARPGFALRTDSDVAQLSAIRAGFGIGVCQMPIAAMMPELVRVLDAEFQLGLEVWVVMHEDLQTSARCRAVFDALVAGLAPLTRAP